MRTATTKFGFTVVAQTQLGALVTGMAEGAFSDITVTGWNWDLIETGSGTNTILAFANKAYWDDYDKKWYFWGSGHSPTRGVHIRYDDATNTVAEYDPPGIPPVEGPKHSYEHIAFQPRTGQKGVLYYRNYYGYEVERLDLETGNWDQITNLPGSSKQVAGALEWFPELYGGVGGLVFVDGDWGVKTWNSSTDTWENLGDVNPMGPYHNVATYLPDQQVVLFGGGNGSSSLFQIDANKVITQRNNAPANVGVDSKGFILASPGKKITFFSFNNNIYEHDYDADTWTNVGSHTLYSDGPDQWLVGASIDDYGCAMFMINGGSNPLPAMRVYKFNSSPYPSPPIQSVAFDDTTFYRTAQDGNPGEGSDNWASTWGADGEIYTTWGDGVGFGGSDSGMGVAKITGGPDANFSGSNLWRTGRGLLGGKSVGISSIDGVLYMFAGPNSGNTAADYTWLQYSDPANGPIGTQWTYVPDPPGSSNYFWTRADGMAKPTICNFGQDNNTAPDNYVYVYGRDSSVYPNEVDLNLARVLKANILSVGSYEYYNGLDGNGDPIWSSNVAVKTPTLTDSLGGVADTPAVMYNSGLSRYIMTKTHDTGDPAQSHGGLGIYEAKNPWGPWREVYYQDDWQGSDNMYFCEMSSKWVSADGLTNWMIFTGYGFDAIAKDAYQHMKVTFTI